MPSRRTLLSNAPPSAQRPRSSARSGTATPSRTHQSTSSNRAARDKIGLPPYEPPICPLDLTARRALSELSSNANETRKYNAELGASVKLLGESVAEINDRYTERKARLDHRLERLQQQRAEGQDAEMDEETQELQDAVGRLRDDVPDLTKSCEESVREVIDWSVELEDSRQAMASTLREVEEESREAERRELAAKERRERIREARERRRENGQMPEDEDEDVEEEDDEDEDAPGEEPIEITGPLDRLKDNKAQLQIDYEEKSLHQRYGLNNDYIQFKKMWHDAAHGRDGKPLPDASKWFNDNNGDDEGDDDEDEDLVVEGERKSLRCPLSMIMMTEPYTSAKCNHTFEKRAIVEFLSNKPGRKAVCPQTGCSQEVSIKDFSLDRYMLHHINRSRRQEDEEDDDEDMDEEEDADMSMQVTSQRNIKKERRRDDIVDEDNDDVRMDEV